MVIRIIGFLAAFAAVAPAYAATPSFDCSKADSSAETLICKDETLAALDREMARLYRLARTGSHMTPARRKELASFQVGWIKGRNDCWKAANLRTCVLDNYVFRIHELRQGFSDARQQDAKGASVGPLAVDCKGFGAAIGATFVNVDKSFVVLQWRREFHVLTQTRSGSGARYAKKMPNGEMVFWNKGDQALFQQPGMADRNCRIEKVG